MILNINNKNPIYTFMKNFKIINVTHYKINNLLGFSWTHNKQTNKNLISSLLVHNWKMILRPN